MRRLDTYNWESPGHANEGNGREGHEGGNDHKEGVATAANGLVDDWIWEDRWLYFVSCALMKSC